MALGDAARPSVRQAAAFAPAHLSGIFEIHDSDPEVGRRGSRGAGVCLDLGATTAVTAMPADSFTIEVFINGILSEAPVTRRAVTDVTKEAVRDGKLMLNRDAPQGQRARIHLRVETTLDLPVSQGFGMSAAGALSSALAAARTLGLGRSVAVNAAHAADVENRTGLGDVAGAITGGFEIRSAPGIPPFGSGRQFVGYGDLVLAVVGPPIATASVLRDSAARELVNQAGKEAIDELLRGPSLESFFEQSRRFAERSELITPQVSRALDLVGTIPDARASMSMLGNSIFAHGPVERIEKALAPVGEVWRATVDPNGARLLAVQPPPPHAG
ncbi:MAG: GHMP family kinase ATP-binding protein [Thermoplasmatota archaeon]